MHRYALEKPDGFVVSYFDAPEVPLRLATGSDLRVLDTYDGIYLEAVAA